MKTAVGASESRPNRFYQASCECGWLGKWRDSKEEAKEECKYHVEGGICCTVLERKDYWMD